MLETNIISQYKCHFFKTLMTNDLIRTFVLIKFTLVQLYMCCVFGTLAQQM